jgi:hypothetical protein
MRLLAFSIAMLLSAPPASAAAPIANPYGRQAACPETPMSLARKQAETPQLRRLHKLPPASAFAAVDRRVGGCPAPLTLTRQKFGR